MNFFLIILFTDKKKREVLLLEIVVYYITITTYVWKIGPIIELIETMVKSSMVQLRFNDSVPNDN